MIEPISTSILACHGYLLRTSVTGECAMLLAENIEKAIRDWFETAKFRTSGPSAP